MSSLEQFIQKQDNKDFYKIMFRNAAGLSVENIKNIFSEFGTVIDVKETGNETGYRFIIYKNYDSAKKALETYFGHDNFDFKVLKNNQKPKENKKYNGPIWENHKNYDENNEKFQANTKNVLLNKENNLKHIQENTKNFPASPRDISSKKDSFHANVKNVQENKESVRAITMSIDNDKWESKKFSALTGAPIRSYQLDDILERNTNQTKMFPNKSSNKVTASSCISESNQIFDVTTNESEDRRKIKIIESQAVVVGNIPIFYNEGYLLHLFENYEPCAVTKITTVPGTSTRYCCIYFKSVQDSFRVESMFDNYELDGQNLIVLRESKLAQKFHRI